MTAKEYLEQVGNKEIYVRNLQKKIERLRKVLDSAGAVQYDTTKVRATHTTDKINDLYAKMDEQQQLVDNLMIDLDDERYKNILHQKYIEMKTWKEIAIDMSYNVRYLFRIHGAALNEFYKMYNKPELIA